ncbi:MAG: hypothetical protein DMF49_03640 [Acidobacteria bacterium]|nr:MAG: hypothetical protein DMF49_03640 [Acidobacteriota bacterium]
MKFFRFTVVAVAATMLFAGVFNAAALKEGTNELELTFSYTDNDAIKLTDGTELVSGSKDLTLDGLWGIMLSNNHEVGPVLTYSRFDPDKGSTTEAGSIGGFYRYNFESSGSIIPFVGAFAAKNFGDLDDVFSWQAEGHGGIRVMASDSAAVNVQAFYLRNFGKSDFDDQDVYGIRAGLSIFFGK